MKWVKAHPMLILFLVFFTILLPVIVGCLAAFIVNERPIIILSALAGWPDLNQKPAVFSAVWVGLGFGVSVMAVFGIPTILGVVVTVLLENAGRRVAMSILDYLEDRDHYFTTEVYSAFKSKLKEGITEKECRDTARAAIKRAAKNWQDSTEANILQALRETDVPKPSGDVATGK